MYQTFAALLLFLTISGVVQAPIFAQQDTAAQSAPQNTPQNTPQTIAEIRVIGNRRIPKETVLARLFSHPGDAYDPITVERDFNSLWNTAYFENVRIEREDTPKGVILNIYVQEKPTIREINPKGLNSVTWSDVLDRFKKEKVGLTVESQYDPTKVERAVVVLRQLLSEHGHQFAVVKVDVKTIPPASVAINFNIKEGPTVKVGKIEFTGNAHYPTRDLRRSMKNLKPIGIPRSIFFENLFAKTYDASKLEEDAERVRQAYHDKGYYSANVGDPETRLRDESGLSLITFRPRKGKRIDITLPVEEGERYRLGSITFTGNKAVSNTKALRSQFAIKDGDWFSATAIGKGLEALHKAYGQLGYINFVGIPKPEVDEAKKVVNLNIDIDEGKQYYVSRIEFTGNTLTRDSVIRRELLLEEGQAYNSHLWELSLLRLNQLQYFEPLKVEEDSTPIRDDDNSTVQLLLKVKEKGKNSIGLNGGVSGLSGAFLGLNYQTNNFLGLGETLSVQASLGNVARNLLFGFTEPYFRNRPLSLGFQIYTNKTDYNASKNYKLSTGQSLNAGPATSSLLQNYNQSTTGLSFSASYPIRHSFKRVGFTYTLNRSNVTAFSAASSNLFQTLAFRSGIQGQNALDGIVNSMASFSFSENRIDNPYKPRNGQELSAAFQLAGLWGNVRYISPVVEFKQFHSMRGLHFSPEGRNVFGYKLQAEYIQGISGDVAPPFNRFYSGGEQDLRGFDVRSATPYGFIPTRVLFTLTNPDGTGVPRDPTNPTLGNIQIPIPVYGIVSMGGDTQLTSNMEYRIPIAGPVTFAFFNDFGIDVVLRKSQLRQSPQGIAQLNAPLYGCPNYFNGSCQGGQQIQFATSIRPIYGTNLVPRMSTGGELQVILPVVNAPFRIYYAYNPLRLFKQFEGENLITRSMFPAGGAGDFSYAESQQLYGSLYQLREPSKTFRLTVSTTF
ncbi:outer membrane protein assembly factor BamA [Acidisarcina polymorpha]|nr:outer membrane protein assembly factor BamA [Acidisarcina polymorpha]